MTDLPPGRLTVIGSGQSCSASWYSESSRDRGTVELDTLGGPDEWWVARALVQGSSDIRGKGIGSTLLRLALEKAIEMGATRVRVVPGGYGANPKQQQRFYERNGFLKTRDLSGWVWVWERGVP